MSYERYEQHRLRSLARRRGTEPVADEGERSEAEGGCPEPAVGRDSTDPRVAEAAREIVLRSLTASAKSRQQLEDKLAEKNVPYEIARAVLDRFEEVQLVDDSSFAQAYVRSRAATRKLSRSALRRELAEKGVRGELAEAALEQRTAEDEHEDARQLVRKKLSPSLDLEDRAERDRAVRRLAGMLARRGYGPDLALGVVREEIDRRRSGEGAELS